MKRPHPPTRADRRWRLTLLGFSFWSLCALMQIVGLLHGYAHPKHRLVAQVQTAAAVGAPQPSGAWRALFSGHEGDSGDCQLFDQLSHAQALMPSLDAATLLPCATACRVGHAAWFHARQAAGYLARGPPQCA